MNGWPSPAKPGWYEHHDSIIESRHHVGPWTITQTRTSHIWISREEKNACSDLVAGVVATEFVGTRERG